LEEKLRLLEEVELVELKEDLTIVEKNLADLDIKDSRTRIC